MAAEKTGYVPKESGVKVNALTKIKKGGLVVAGTVFVGLGTLGIFLPLLPTTVFLLLAAYCYARSSEKFYNWLIGNKWFGSYISNYRDKKGISIKVKLISTSLLWISILYSVLFIVENLYVRSILLLIAIGVSIHILTIRTYREVQIQEVNVTGPVKKTIKETTQD